MATALAKGLVNAGLAAPEKMIASDPIAAGREAFGQALGCQTTDSNSEVLAKAKVIFLAFKPHQLDEATEAVHDQFTDEHLVISILAGVRLTKLDLNGTAVVDLAPLSSLVQLTALRLCGTAVADLGCTPL